jgi:phosphoesterase RecJ-like protein
VNVAAIAERLGGGGHGNAAGCTREGPLAHALEEILVELRRSVNNFMEGGV